MTDQHTAQPDNRSKSNGKNTDLLDQFHNPKGYVMDERLQGAVEVAQTLGVPLLVTGAPGTGKTELARRIAYDLYQADPEKNRETIHLFNTKSTSEYTDLFYTYDAIRHFRDSNIEEFKSKAGDPTNYIRLQALGAAIALTNEQEIKENPIYFQHYQVSRPQNAVVLIDEIDKAPKDFPNDLLNEIEHWQFFIREAHNKKIKKGDNHQIFVVMTSNSEKNLPEAFLRRCVYYHIPSPSPALLKKIVMKRIEGLSEGPVEKAIAFFDQIRKNPVLRQPPATDELLKWIYFLHTKSLLDKDLEQLDADDHKIFNYAYSILGKNQLDLEELVK